MPSKFKSPARTAVLTIRNCEELDFHLETIKQAAGRAHDWIAAQSSDPLDFLRNIKFEKRGHHPITHHPLNLIEQVNQTWTYAVALEATRYLLTRHPDAQGFKLAPGASASQDLDIMSLAAGLVGAETFAATSPESNKKITKDRNKLKSKEGAYVYRYVFFSCPTHPFTMRREEYEKKYPGIQVWSLIV